MKRLRLGFNGHDARFDRKGYGDVTKNVCRIGIRFCDEYVTVYRLTIRVS